MKLCGEKEKQRKETGEIASFWVINFTHFQTRGEEKWLKCIKYDPDPGYMSWIPDKIIHLYVIRISCFKPGCIRTSCFKPGYIQISCFKPDAFGSATLSTTPSLSQKNVISQCELILGYYRFAIFKAAMWIRIQRYKMKGKAEFS